MNRIFQLILIMALSICIATFCYTRLGKNKKFINKKYILKLDHTHNSQKETGKQNKKEEEPKDRKIFGLKSDENPLPPPPARDILLKSRDTAGVPTWDVDLHLKQYDSGYRDPKFNPFRVMKLMGLKPGDSIADIGCGYGYFTFRFSRVVGEKGKVYAVDLDERAIDTIKLIKERDKDLEGETFDNINIVKCSNKSPGLPENSIDIAFMCWVGYYRLTEFHREPPWDKPLKSEEAKKLIYNGSLEYTKNIYDSLRENGRLVIIDESGSDTPRGNIDKDDVVELLEKSGFKLENEYDIIDDFYFLVFRKIKGNS